MNSHRETYIPADIEDCISRAVFTRWLAKNHGLSGSWVEIAMQHWIIRHCAADGDYLEMVLDALEVTYTTEQIDNVLKDAGVGIMHLDELCQYYGILKPDPNPEHPLIQLARLGEDPADG